LGVFQRFIAQSFERCGPIVFSFSPRRDL
jgi:hypothetical protein